MIDGVVLAGGTIPDSESHFRDAVGVNYKSLIPLNGRIMVYHVLGALRGCERIKRVAVVGPPELKGHPDCAAADVVLEEGAGRSENLFLALDAFPDAEHVLMVTSDLPLMTPEGIDDFLDNMPPEVDIGYAFVRAETVLAKYADRPAPPPDSKGRQMPNWVTIALRDGRFTGTACLLFKRAAIEKCRAYIKKILDDREMGSVINTLRPVFGLWFLIRVGLVFKLPALAWLVSIADIERTLGRGLGITCRGYISPYADMAFDVDHLTDVAIAEKVLRERSRL